MSIILFVFSYQFVMLVLMPTLMWNNNDNDKDSLNVNDSKSVRHLREIRKVRTWYQMCFGNRFQIHSISSHNDIIVQNK